MKTPMTKGSKPLWGTSKDAYFRRILRSEPGLGAAASERIFRRLQADVVQVRLRDASAELTVSDGAAAAVGTPGTLDAAAILFDPYSPNVVVVVRTAGRERALAALSQIERVEHLRMLAREQQLSIEAELESAADIRAAIVSAAERRIANRRAAAS